MNLKNITVTKKVLSVLTLIAVVFMVLAFVAKNYYIPNMEKQEYKLASQKLVKLIDEELKLKREVGSSNVTGIVASNAVIATL